MDAIDVFVGREFELDQLNKVLKTASEGSLQICLLAGDPGDGKTTLVEHFTKGVKDNSRNLDYAIGTSDINSGQHDIYDPFRDIFTQLTGMRAKSIESFMATEREFDLRNLIRFTVEILRDFAPELIGTLVPGAALVSKAGLSVTDKVIKRRIEVANDIESTVRHEEIRQQSVLFFQKRTKEGPLVLIFDDMQWMDELSLKLLRHLIDHLPNVALLLILTYRPSELVPLDEDRHNLTSNLINKVKQDYNPLEIDLRESRIHRGFDFVSQFLEENDCNITDNNGFVDEFLKRTEARPIFAVELLNFLKDRNVLQQNSLGIWEEVDSTWKEMSPRLTRLAALTDARLSRLSEELREILRIASIEGFEFTAQVIVSITGIDERTVLRVLSDELSKRHDFVREMSEGRIGEKIVSHFRFTNVWYQDHIYKSISLGEKRLLHEKVASSLEALYGEHASQIAVNLSRHYEGGQNPTKAAFYLIEAGVQQASNKQHEEAFRTLEQALKLAHSASYTRGMVDALRYIAVKVKLDQGGKKAFADAEELLKECIHLAEKENFGDVLGYANRAMGRVHRYFGRYTEAMYCYMESLNIAKQSGDNKGIGACFTNMGVLAQAEERYENARFYFEKRLKLAEEMDDDEGKLLAYFNLGICLRQLAENNEEGREYVLEQAGQVLGQAKQINDLLINSSRDVGIKIEQAHVLVLRGNFASAAMLLHESINDAQKGNFRGRIVAGFLCFADLTVASENKNPLLVKVIDYIKIEGSNPQRKKANTLMEIASSQYPVQELKKTQPPGQSDDVYTLVQEVLSVLNQYASSC